MKQGQQAAVEPVAVEPVSPKPAEIVAETAPPAAPAKPSQTWKEWFAEHQLLLRLISFFVEIIPFLIAAIVYNMYRHKMDFRQDAAPMSNGFSYSLLGCHQDVKISLLAWCCAPIRWADTMDKASVPPVMKYWVAVFTFIILLALNPLLAGTTSILLLFLCTYGRQRLRQELLDQKGMRPVTILEDCCTYMWCGCCAVVQEAREVEARR